MAIVVISLHSLCFWGGGRAQGSCSIDCKHCADLAGVHTKEACRPELSVSGGGEKGGQGLLTKHSK